MTDPNKKIKTLASCEAVAPSSTANLGPGFDVFGLSLDLFHDKVIARKYESTNGKINISVSNHNSNFKIPTEVKSNSAGLAVSKMCSEVGIKNDIELSIFKAIPPGYGLGSSAASAAAAVVAINHLFDVGCSKKNLIEFAAEGEIASAGTRHYDNVAASLLGGFVIIKSAPNLDFIRIEAPSDLAFVLAIPNLPVPERKTEIARSVLPNSVPLRNVTHNVAAACFVVSGFLLKDIELIAKGMDDIIVEPARKALVKGFDKVKEYALSEGALAVTISGAGPSIIALANADDKSRSKIADAMKRGFLDSGIDGETYLCKPAAGARIVSQAF
jgi:homoserine kinase